MNLGGDFAAGVVFGGPTRCQRGGRRSRVILGFAHCLIMSLWRAVVLYFWALGEVFNFLVIDDCWVLKYQSFLLFCF